jgi:hypothetical protein
VAVAAPVPHRHSILSRVCIGVCVLATIVAGAVPFGALVVGLALAHAFKSDERLKNRFAMLGGVVTILVALWVILAPSGVTTHSETGTVTAPTQQR